MKEKERKRQREEMSKDWKRWKQSHIHVKVCLKCETFSKNYNTFVDLQMKKLDLLQFFYHNRSKQQIFYLEKQRNKTPRKVWKISYLCSYRWLWLYHKIPCIYFYFSFFNLSYASWWQKRKKKFHFVYLCEKLNSKIFLKSENRRE